MNRDMVPVQQLEQGIKTLTHNWRNILNGINLHVLSAGSANTREDRDCDLAAAGRSINSATSEVASLYRHLMPPQLSPIPYPTGHLVDDVAANFEKRTEISDRVDWQRKLNGNKALVDFAYFSEALNETLENSLRYLPTESRLTISAAEESGCLTFSWSEEKETSVCTESWGKTPFLTTVRGHLGLGLYFAHRVLKAHGGSLDFDFSPSAKLLRTRLSIPLEKP